MLDSVTEERVNKLEISLAHAIKHIELLVNVIARHGIIDPRIIDYKVCVLDRLDALERRK